MIERKQEIKLVFDCEVSHHMHNESSWSVIFQFGSLYPL